MSDDQSARLALPYLAAGQMQKHVTLNEALTRLDALVQATAVSRTVAVQPAAPADGDLHVLPAGAEGAAWSAFGAGELARAEAGVWTVVDAPEGALVFIADAGEFVVRRDGGWMRLGEVLRELGPLDRLGVGTDADAGNPFAAKLNKALWTAREAASGGDGDLRLTLNKETASDVLSLLFQSGYGGRAELGLVGDDDLVLNVSSDGGAWRNAFSVDRATGRVTFSQGAGRRETTMLASDGVWTPPAWARTVEVIAVAGGGGGGSGAFGSSGDRYGGGGGGAGGIARAIWPADRVAEGLTVTIGGGGAGGTGSGGVAGGDTVIALGPTPILTAAGGEGGDGGAGSAGVGGSGGAGAPRSNDGGASSLSAAGAAGDSRQRPDAPGGGGAGGGLNAGGTARAGGAGGDGGALAVRAQGGLGGESGGGWGGWSAPLPDLHWAGGGGGGGGAAASGSGHAGAAGGGSGAGGGGGGAGVVAGGAGGSGAAGIVWLTAEG
jgi:hypothetical protein